MNVTFCGHSQIWKREEVKKWIFNVTKKLIQQGATTFYLGGYGAFDSLVASVLRELKKDYPQIELILVLAYLNTERNTSGYQVAHAGGDTVVFDAVDPHELPGRLCRLIFFLSAHNVIPPSAKSAGNRPVQRMMTQQVTVLGC